MASKEVTNCLTVNNVPPFPHVPVLASITTWICSNKTTSFNKVATNNVTYIIKINLQAMLTS